MICYDVDQKCLYFHKDEMCAISVVNYWLLNLLASYFAYQQSSKCVFHVLHCEISKE